MFRLKKVIRKLLDRLFVKRALRRLLDDPRYSFRKLKTLAKVTGCTPPKLFDKLAVVGARPAYRNNGQDNDLWGSTRRVGSRPRRRSRR